MVGWIAYERRRASRAEDGQPLSLATPRSSAQSSAPPKADDHAPAAPAPSPLLQHIRVLGAQEQFTWEAQHAAPPAFEYVYLASLYTLPTRQRQGIGRALVEHCLAEADARGVPVALNASPVGWRMYERCGFRVWREVELDLREWVDGERRERAEDQGFGVYCSRWMVREGAQAKEASLVA